MVERQKERYGWEFLFLGANITSSTEGGRSQSHPFWGLQDRAGRCAIYGRAGDTLILMRIMIALCEYSVIFNIINHIPF